MESEQVMQKVRQIGLGEIKKGNAPPEIYTWLAIEKGVQLAKEMNADVQVVEAALWLGDSQLALCMKQNRPQDHVKVSAEFAQIAMKGAGASEKFIEKAVQAMTEHHSTQHKSIEGEIVANADGYKFLQPLGLLALIMKDAKKRPDLETLKYALSKLEEKWNVLTISQCKKEMQENYNVLKFVLESAIQKALEIKYEMMVI